MKGKRAGCCVDYACRLSPPHPLEHRSIGRGRDGHSRDETLPVISFGEDIKPSTLAWHIQRKHPQEYDVLLGMGEEELKEVAEEMSRVRG